MRAITMLIVFCPCVMVLATPTALVASIGNAALRGSLVKQGATIEALSTINTVAFDKTGTLTFGRPKLVDVVALNGVAESEVLRLTAVAEKFSEHPLGRAMVQAAEARGLPVVDPDAFETLPGLGIQAQSKGRLILLGRVRLLAERGVAVGRERFRIGPNDLPLPEERSCWSQRTRKQPAWSCSRTSSGRRPKRQSSASTPLACGPCSSPATTAPPPNASPANLASARSTPTYCPSRRSRSCGGCRPRAQGGVRGRRRQRRSGPGYR